MILSQNEWDPLTTVVVGYPVNSKIPEMDDSLRLINYGHELDSEKLPPSGSIPAEIIEETREDIDKIGEFLFSIEVSFNDIPLMEVCFPNAEVNPGYGHFTPRDTLFFYKDLSIVCPSPLRARKNEVRGWKHYLNDPVDADIERHEPYIHRKDDLYDKNSLRKQNILAVTEAEPAFEGCNILKANDTVFYLVNNRANKKGAALLQEILGNRAKVCVIENLCKHTRLNNIMSFLNEGLLIADPSIVKDKSQLPKELQKWDIIWAPDEQIVETHEFDFDPRIKTNVNVFMINPKLAMIDENQPELAKLLNSKGIDVHLTRLRNQKILRGGLHSVILDHDRGL